MKILGVDPGTSIVGYAVVERTAGTLRLLGADAICAAPGAPQEEKLRGISVDLAYIIKTYKPDVLAVEKLFTFKNTKTVISVAEARGVIVLTGATSGLTVYEYTPLQVKMAVTGYGKADKRQVHIMTGAILKLPVIPILDDITDAIAIAICAAHSIPRDPL